MRAFRSPARLAQLSRLRDRLNSLGDQFFIAPQAGTYWKFGAASPENVKRVRIRNRVNAALRNSSDAVTDSQLTQLATLQTSGFLGLAQTRAIAAGLGGEERDFFADKLRELIERVGTMPKAYEQEGRGDDAVAHLHYFLGGFDWYITERDMEQEQHQAFGWARLGGVGPDGGELGYISLAEITDAGAELDLFFSPAPLGELRRRHR